MKGFIDLPYRLPFVRHYRAFDAGFYVDFERQLDQMGRWLREFGCRRTLDIGAMTGGCIEHISGLGIRMDGVLFTPDIRRLARERLRRAGIASTLYVSPVHAVPRVAGRNRYDGIVSLGWFNLPWPEAVLTRYLRKIHDLLAPGGVFLFDFFEMRQAVVAPLEAVRLADDLLYLSEAEREGRRLRRRHWWVVGGRELRTETSELVDRRPGEARARLRSAGLEPVRSRFLDLHYPRHFWAARKPPARG